MTVSRSIHVSANGVICPAVIGNQDRFECLAAECCHNKHLKMCTGFGTVEDRCYKGFEKNFCKILKSLNVRGNENMKNSGECWWTSKVWRELSGHLKENGEKCYKNLRKGDSDDRGVESPACLLLPMM